MFISDDDWLPHECTSHNGKSPGSQALLASKGKSTSEPCITEVSGLPNLCANNSKDTASCMGIKLPKAMEIFGKFADKFEYKSLNLMGRMCMGKSCTLEARTAQDEYMSNATCVQKAGDKAECKWKTFILQGYLNGVENGTIPQ